MPVSEMLLEGGRLMLLGMSIVFCFLVLLVFAMSATARLTRLFESRAAGADPACNNRTASATVDDPELISVISAAVTLFRTSHR